MKTDVDPRRRHRMTVLQRLGWTRVQPDDLLDAAACLLASKRVAEGGACVLGDGAVDSRGLRMEIVA